MKEVLPILKAINDFNDFCNRSTTEPLLSRVDLAVNALKSTARPLSSSAFTRVRDIGRAFEESVDERFKSWLTTDVILASKFLDPYVSYTMSRDHFISAKDIVKSMMVVPSAVADEDDDMFTAAGAGVALSPIDSQLKEYVEHVRAVKSAPPVAMPSSLSWWEAKGSSMPLVLRVYMNLGSIMLCSTPSEAVFNQLALTVRDRRGSLRDDRAAALTLSAAVAKLERDNLARLSATTSAADDDVLEAVMEQLGAEASGVLSAKYVDLVADEFDSYDEFD